MNDPKTARRGVLAGVVGDGAGRRRHAARARHRRTGAGSRSPSSLGFAVGVPLSWVPLTAVPQRTALSHAFGGLAAGLVGTAKFYLWLGEPGEPDAVPHGRDRRRGHARLPDLHRQPDGRRQAAGGQVIPQRPVTYPLPERRATSACSAVAVGCGVALVVAARSQLVVPVPGDHRARARLRRAADHPDRRRRHADGDLAAELVRRPVGGRDGLRARQQAADHRGRARRLLRPDPVDHHVPGDEPLVHQRAVRRVRPGAGEAAARRGARPSRARRAEGAAQMLEQAQPGRDRARLRHGGRPGAAPRAASCTSSSRSAASTCGSRSTRSPAACRAT